MAAAIFVVLVAFLAAVAAQGDDHCTNGSYGNTTGDSEPLELQTMTLFANNAAWQVPINSVWVCDTRNSTPVGVFVTACDPSGPPAPTVRVVSLDTAKVTRNSYLNDDANVTVSVYCS